MDTFLNGAFAFGLVIGWVTYRALRRATSSGISDIASVIGAVGGAAVTALFPQGSQAFGYYCIGLAVGFFAYLIVSIVIARCERDPQNVSTWLGEVRPAPPGEGDYRRPPTT